MSMHYIFHIYVDPTKLQSEMCTSNSLFTTGPYIGHMVTTDTGSSGSPILKEYHNTWAVVGLHRGTNTDAEINIATHISVIVDDILGEAYDGEGMLE